MHINPNATLLVQIFHFGIAYILLRNLLLKPAIDARNQEQAVKDAALEIISRRQQQIEQTIYAQHQVWRTCNNYFATQKPTIITQTILRDLPGSQPTITISDQEKIKAVNAATALVQKTIGERL